MIIAILKEENSKTKVLFTISTCHPDVFQAPTITLGKHSNTAEWIGFTHGKSYRSTRKCPCSPIPKQTKNLFHLLLFECLSTTKTHYHTTRNYLREQTYLVMPEIRSQLQFIEFLWTLTASYWTMCFLCFVLFDSHNLFKVGSVISLIL